MLDTNNASTKEDDNKMMSFMVSFVENPLYRKYRTEKTNTYRLVWKCPDKNDATKDAVRIVRYLSFLEVTNFSIAKSVKGKKAAAKDSVPYAIQTTINPENMNVTEPISDGNSFSLFDLKKRYVPIPAIKGWSNTFMLQASMNGRIRNNKLSGEKTAD